MTSVLIRLAAGIVSPVGIALGIYLLARGHHSPGGGFVAAVVVGLVVVLRHWAWGPQAVQRLLRLGVGNLIGIGVLLMLGTGAAGWWWGDHFLETASTKVDLVVAQATLSSAHLLELGVAITVVSVVVAVLGELGERDA